MSRHPGFTTALVTAIFVAQAGILSGAGGTITGTVKTLAGASAADAVVYIQQAPGTSTPGDAAVMNQRSSEFLPKVLPVVAGTTVKFPNADPIAHNVFSPDFEKYDLGTWSQGDTKDHTFAACAKPPCVYVQLCKIHPQMNAYIVVLQNPYFGVTDKSGRYLIENVPPGDYTMTVWYATRTRQYNPPARPVTVAAGGPATVDFALAR